MSHRPARRPVRRRPSRRTGHGVLVLLVGIIGTLALVPLAPSADAAVIRSFTKVYSAQINGSIQVTGNTLLTCAASATCTSARNGTSTANGNNQFTMVRLDTDNDPSTAASSTANITLPAGATVAKAYLFWGASATATGASSTIKFRTPAAGYQTLTSEGRDTQAGHYSAYRDVTDLVQAGGAGTYAGADIPLAFGSADQYAGWSLVVAVADPAAPLRDLSIFSGYASVSSGNNATASISGFLTPPSGAVVSKVGMVVYEGDIQLTGDQFQINGVAQSDGSAGSTTNFFNSRISDNGAILTNRNPADVNSLGTEVKTFSTTAIPNNATSANLAFSSTGDVYFPAALTSQIDLYAPTIVGGKTVTNLTRNTTAQVGDLLEYQMTFTNTGDDNATNSVLRDPLPANVTYVPGSIQVTAGPNTGAKTDATGDDVGEYVAAERTVRVRIGSGATATAGGTLAKNVATTVKFRAILTDPSAGTIVDNAALLDYRAPQIGRDYTYTSAVVSTPVTSRADVAITKTASPTNVVAGAPLTYTLSVTNNGENTATGTVVSDTLPADVTFTSATTAGGTCANASGTVTCQLGDVPNGATRTIEILTQVRPTFTGSSITNVATVSSDLSDPVAANNTASATSTVTRAADVQVTKTASPASPVPGRDVTYTIAVRNNGPSTANAVNLADTLPAAFVTSPAVTASTTTGTCTVGGRTVACELGNVAPGTTATVTVVGRLDPTYTGGAVANTASATTTTPDPTPGNNSSTATFTPAAPQADLVVDKTTVTNPVVPGRPVEYRITVTNNGPSDAVGVVLADAVPSTITGVAVTPSQGTCTTAVSCALGTVPAGSTATVTVTGVVVAGAVGTVTNTATVSSGTTDPTPGNNSGSTSDTVQPRADVSISKTAGPVVAGGDVTYTVTVTNNGPSVARDVVATDPVPSPLTLVSATGSQGTCTTPGATARCAFGILAPGASATMTVVAGTPADGSADGAVNTATVATSTTDPTPGNNTASHTLTTGAQADISLTKTAAPAQLVAGGPVTFTLTARNNGPSNASGVSIVDTLPAEVTLGTLPAGCSRSGQTVTCTISTLAAGNTFVVQIPGTVSATSTPGTLSNTATVSTATPIDPSPANNTASSTTPVVTRADLALVKTGPARAVAGGVVEYTVTVTNNGPSAARDVVVTDDLPDGAGLVSSPGCDLQPGSTSTVTCAFGTVPAGGVVTTTLRVSLAASQADGSTVTNRAQASSTTIDPTPGNNTATAATVVDTRADLAVTKTATPTTLVAGQEAVYTVTVTNNGPSDARTPSLVDTLPSGVTLVSATTPSGSCTGTSVVTCERGTLAASATWTVTIRVLVGAGTTAAQVNAVTVASATTETTPADNSFQLTSPVTVAGDLSVVKTVQPTPAVPGRQVVFGLTAVNNGPSTTPGTVLTDVLPAGLSGATVTLQPTTAGTCDVAGGTVTCTLGALAPGQPVTATVTAILAPGYAGATLSNTATITSGVTDPTPGDNSSTVTTPVTPEADLTVTKRADTATIVAGEPFEYTVEVGNAGPSVARDVVVTDQVPADLTIVSATVGVGGPACSVSGQQVTCTLGTVSPGVPVTVVIRVRPQNDVAGAQVSNTASATSSTADPTPGDNSSTLVLPVTTQADVRVVKTRTVPASGPVVPGSRVTWTVTVTNPTGPSTARGVVVDDAVDPALTGVTATGAGGGCSVAADNRVSCTIGRLDVGDSATVTISGIVPASYTGGAGGTLVNTATASSTTADPAPGNNTSTVTDTVRADAAVSVTKTRTVPASGPIVPGRPVSWLVTVTNAGPSVARGVTVSDDVVDTLTGVTATVAGAPAGATCQVGAANLVTCTLGDLPVGSATVTITADVPAGYTGVLDNTVQVASPTDTTPGDNSATSTGTAQPSADVAVTKTRTLPASGPVVPGQPVAWEVTVDNLGPSVATGVTITDDVINALTGVTATVDGGAGTCTVTPGGDSPNLVTCALGGIAPSAAPVVVTIRGDVPPSYTGTAGNTVSVDTTTPDPVAGNDTATVGGSAQPAADVSITKTRTAPVSGPIVPGSDVEWTVTVTNAGPSSAADVTLTDDVLDVLSGVTASGAGATCTVGTTNRVACDLPDLAPQQSVSVVVRGGVPAGYTGPVDNTAVVASPTDTTPGNNTATSTGTAQPQADVSITKSRTSGAVVPGRPVSWSIVVSNAGPSVARQVTVADDVLDTLTGVQALVVGSPAGVTCSVSTSPVTLNLVTCDLGALAVGGTVTITVTGDVPAGYTGAVDNTATVDSPTDTTPANNTATSTGTAQPQADVSVTKTRTSGPVVPGRDVAWSVVVTNAGPSLARDVTLTDDVLDALTGVTATGTGATCDVGTDNAVTCDLGDLAPGATVTVTVTGSVPAGYTGSGDNTVTVDSPTDTTPGNNTATSPGAVQPQADVSVTKTRTSGAPVPGQPVTWSVVVTNAGPSVALDVTVADDVLDALTGVTATGTGATCDVGTDNAVTCDLGDLAPAATVTIAVTGALPAGYTGSADNTVTVDSPTDTTPGNNEATSTGTAAPVAAVSIDKVRTSGPVVPGQDVTWQVLVTNAGPSVARDVVVTDDLLDVLTDVTATGAACQVGTGNAVTCDLGDLPASGPGSSVTITVTGGVPADLTGAVDNTAVVDSPTDDNTDDNTATSTATAQPEADLTIVKARPSGPVVAGTPVTWEVTVTNNGPSVATEVVVTDDVDDAVTGLVPNPGQGSCLLEADNEVTCTVGTLAPGDSTTITLTGDVPAAFTGRLDNTARVDSPTDDTPGNNEATILGDATSAADISIVKARTSGPAVPGLPITWTLTVDNRGPSDATNVTIDDDVVDALTGVTAEVTGGPAGITCTVGDGNEIRCDLGTVAPTDAPIVVTVRGSLPAGYTGGISNTANVASVPADGNTSDNSSTSDGTATPRADVSIAKTRTSGAVVPGQPVAWRIAVTNGGPSTARDVVVTDDVLDALTGLDAQVTGAPTDVTCTVTTGNVVTCPIGEIPPGSDPVVVTVRGDLPAGYTGAVDNTAVVDSPTDTTPGNNEATSTGTAAPQADVSIAKTRTSGTIVPGQRVTWNVVVTNSGPSVARDVTITDDLLDALAGLEVSAPAGVTCDTATGNVVTCDLGDLPAAAPGNRVTIAVSADLPAGYTGAVDNTAVVVSPTDTTPGNNEATSTGTAAPQADVSIAKTRTSGTIVPGQSVTWQVVVTNDGPSVARGVTVTDDLADELTDVEVTGGADGACTVTTGNTITCTLGDLPPSGAGSPASTVTVTVTADVPADYVGRLDNTATVASPTDTTAGNNTSTSPGTAEAQADVSIVKERISGAIVPGQPVTWSITVTNDGPSVARDVVVTDDLVDTLLVDQADVPAGCTLTATVLTCELGDLPATGPDSTVVLTITADVPADYSGALDNTATVASPTDVTPGNNTSTSTGSAEGRVDLSITKTLVGAAVPGDLVSWTLEVTNGGPSVARDVVVTDELPTSVTDATVTGPAGSTCTVTDGVVTCRLADLGVDETATVTVGGRLTPGFRGDLVNQARVGSSDSETDPDDNTATATDPVSPVADLAVTKEVTPEAPLAGGPVTFTITVTNNGPSTATGAVVTDPLDAVVRDPRVSATSDTTCAIASSTVTCEVADLAPGATAVITVDGTVATDATGPVTNTVTVTPGEETDPEPADNEATVTTGPVQGADLQVVKEALAAEVTAGDRFDYRITVTNAGPATATDVVVTDELPDGMTAVSATAKPRGACSITAGRTVVTCDLGDLAADQVVRVTLTVEVADDAVGGAPATVVNEATVVSTTADPVTGNNADGTPVRVLPADDGGPTGPTGPTDPGAPDLPDTGSDARIPPLTLTAFAALLLGAWLLRRSRRRTS